MEIHDFFGQKREQSQKRYMVSDSLCLTSFIYVEFYVSLLVSAQKSIFFNNWNPGKAIKRSEYIFRCIPATL